MFGVLLRRRLIRVLPRLPNTRGKATVYKCNMELKSEDLWVSGLVISVHREAETLCQTEKPRSLISYPKPSENLQCLSLVFLPSSAVNIFTALSAIKAVTPHSVIPIWGPRVSEHLAAMNPLLTELTGMCMLDVLEALLANDGRSPAGPCSLSVMSAAL